MPERRRRHRGTEPRETNLRYSRSTELWGLRSAVCTQRKLQATERVRRHRAKASRSDDIHGLEATHAHSRGGRALDAMRADTSSHPLTVPLFFLSTTVRTH